MNSLIRKLRSRFSTRWPLLNYSLAYGLEISVKNKMEWVIYNDLFVDGDYDQSMAAILETGQSATVVDLGANVGFFELRLAHLALARATQPVITCYAFEASAKLCTEFEVRTRQLKQLAPFLHTHLTTGLIGERQGLGSFFEFDAHGLNSLFRPNGQPHSVQFVDLAATLQDTPQIDLIKCDIEGSEELFLTNYEDVLAKTKRLVIEFHPEFCNTSRCRELLLGCGFHQTRIVRAYEHGSVEEFGR